MDIIIRQKYSFFVHGNFDRESYVMVLLESKLPKL